MRGVNTLTEVKVDCKPMASGGVHYSIYFGVFEDVNIPIGIVDTFLCGSCHAPSPPRTNNHLNTRTYPLHEILKKARIGAGVGEVQEIDNSHIRPIHFL